MNTKTSSTIRWTVCFLVLSMQSACQLVDNRIRGRITGPGEPMPPLTEVSLALTVEAAYPQNGVRWNDYVENSEEQFFQAADVACNGDGYVDGGTYDSETRFGWDACLHAGEIRKVTVEGAKDCGTLSLVDELGLFDWHCDDGSGTVRFFSKGLKNGKGLKDLVLSNSWRTNRVILSGTSGGVTFSGGSPMAEWWTNPVVPLPDNSATSVILLDGTDDDGGAPGDGSDEAYGAGTVFTLAASRDTNGYHLVLPKMAIVTLDSAVLRLKAGLAYNCAEDTGTPLDGVCLVFARGQPYLWVEGSFDGNGQGDASSAPKNIYLKESVFWKARNVTSSNIGVSPNYGFAFRVDKSHFGQLDTLVAYDSGAGFQSYSSFSRHSRLRLYNNWGGGFAIHGNTGNLFYDIESHDNGSHGVYIGGPSSDNVYVKMKLSHNNGRGLWVNSYLGAPFRNILVDLLVFNNQATAGVELTGTHNIVSHLTGMHNNPKGLRLNASFHGRLTQILLAKSGSSAAARNLEIVSGSNNEIVQYASSHSYNYEIEISGSSQNRFRRNLLVGNPGNLNCSVIGGSSGNNIVNGGATCGPDDPTNDLKIVTTLDLQGSGSFLESPIVADPANADNALISVGAGVTHLNVPGIVNVTQITDWLNFSNFYRGWAKAQNLGFWAMDASNNVGRCTGTDDCVLRDLRLDKDVSVIRNTSFDGVSPNTTFIPGEVCPEAVHGDLAMTLSEKIYLINALELMEDGIGNENGLCERNEACTYSPNFGAYQGDGDPLSQGSCDFVDGLVKNVRMYAFPENGG